MERAEQFDLRHSQDEEDGKWDKGSGLFFTAGAALCGGMMLVVTLAKYYTAAFSVSGHELHWIIWPLRWVCHFCKADSHLSEREIERVTVDVGMGVRGGFFASLWWWIKSRFSAKVFHLVQMTIICEKTAFRFDIYLIINALSDRVYSFIRKDAGTVDG